MLLEKPSVAAYCVTEPDAGSDVAAITTTAKKDGDGYILNGEKMWITNASVASWYFVLATLDRKLGAKGMVCFALPNDLAGITPGKKENNMGQRCSDTRGITFKDVRVPASCRLGEEGDGFKIAMRAFDKSRPDGGGSRHGRGTVCLRPCLALLSRAQHLWQADLRSSSSSLYAGRGGDRD